MGRKMERYDSNFKMAHTQYDEELSYPPSVKARDPRFLRSGPAVSTDAALVCLFWVSFRMEFAFYLWLSFTPYY